jgi:hypothetical protein
MLGEEYTLCNSSLCNFLQHLGTSSYLLVLSTLLLYGYWLQAGRHRGSSSSPGRFKNCYFVSSRPTLRPAQSPIQWLQGSLSSGVKWPRLKADHPPPTSAEVKKTWISTSTLPCIHGVVLTYLNTGTTLPLRILIKFLHNLTISLYIVFTNKPKRFQRV